MDLRPVFMIVFAVLAVLLQKDSAGQSEPAQITVAKFKPVTIDDADEGLKEFRGGFRFEWESKPKTALENGRLEFTVDRSGVIYLAAKWENQGSAEIAWTNERLTKEKLVAAGWVEVGTCSWDESQTLFSKEVKAGEKYQVRINKYWPPALYLKATKGSKSEAIGLVDSASREKKNPIPVKEEEEQARKTITQVYKAEWERAKTADQKAALSKEMMATALETNEDLAAQYSLLRIALNISQKSDDVYTFIAICERLSDRFEVDEFLLKHSGLKQLVGTAKQSESHQALNTVSIDLANASVQADRFELVPGFCEVAQASARNGKQSAGGLKSQMQFWLGNSAA